MVMRLVGWLSKHLTKTNTIHVVRNRASAGDVSDRQAAPGEVRHKPPQKLGDRLKFQIGVSSGAVFASSVGYTKYKSMVCLCFGKGLPTSRCHSLFLGGDRLDRASLRPSCSWFPPHLFKGMGWL